MNYLNEAEKKIITYTNQYTFPPRKQTGIEEAIARIILVQDIPAVHKNEIDAKEAEIDISLNKIRELTANNRLADKVKAALATPEKFEAFTEGYPYAKYGHLINGPRRHSALLQLGADGFTEVQVQQLMRWVAQLALAFYAGLPKGVDTFIWTPFTRHYNMSYMAKAVNDKAFYGYVLPKEEQTLINELFADGPGAARPGGNLWARKHVQRTELHKSPEVFVRLGWGDIAKEVFDKGLEINFGNDYAQGPYWFLELRHEETKTRLRFIIEG